MPAPFGDSAIGKIHFLTSYVWRIWDRSRHFFELLMCAVPIYWDLRQFGICRHLCRGCGSPRDLQYPGYYQRVDRDMIHFAYPSLSKGLLVLGYMVRFSNSQRLLRQACTPHRSINPVMASIWVFAEPPAGSSRPRRSGPNHSLPSPRRAYLWSAATLPAAASISHRLPIRPLSQLQRRSQPISIQSHRTILKRRSQHILKNNRITVYPFTHSANG